METSNHGGAAGFREGEGMVHVTKNGTRYELAQGRFDELVASVLSATSSRCYGGALLPVLLVLAALATQVAVAGRGLGPDPEALGSWVLWAGALAVEPWRWLTHLFLQPNGAVLCLNLLLLLSFSVPLGWRDGAWRVGLPVLLAGMAGGAASVLLTGGGVVGLWYGVAGAVVVAMWRSPTGRVRETVIPSRLMAGLVVLALVPRLVPGGLEHGSDGLLTLDEMGLLSQGFPPVLFAAPLKSHIPVLTATGVALLTGIFLLPAKEMDCGRVGAVATFVAVAFALRLSDRLALLAGESNAWLSAGNWLGIVLDLTLLVIACIYAMSQAEMLKDMRWWPVRDRLDELVAAEGTLLTGDGTQAAGDGTPADGDGERGE